MFPGVEIQEFGTFASPCRREFAITRSRRSATAPVLGLHLAIDLEFGPRRRQPSASRIFRAGVFHRADVRDARDQRDRGAMPKPWTAPPSGAAIVGASDFAVRIDRADGVAEELRRGSGVAGMTCATRPCSRTQNRRSRAMWSHGLRVREPPLTMPPHHRVHFAAMRPYNRASATTARRPPRCPIAFTRRHLQIRPRRSRDYADRRFGDRSFRCPRSTEIVRPTPLAYGRLITSGRPSKTGLRGPPPTTTCAPRSTRGSAACGNTIRSSSRRALVERALRSRTPESGSP